MKNSTLLLIALLFLQLTLSAQAPDTLWTKTFGGPQSDVAEAIEQTSDGGYIITGEASSFSAGMEDFGLIKTDADGNLEWIKLFGGYHRDISYSVQQTMDGGYIVVGYSVSFATGGYADVWLIKTDSDGNEQWSKIYGGSLYDEGYCIRQTSNGGYIICGTTSSYGAGLYDVLLLKVDANGNPLWQKTFGGDGYDVGESIVITPDGGYVITGYQSSLNSNYDISLMKTDSNGNLLWLKNYGGSESDKGYSVKQTSDGGYIITGSTKSFGAGEEDVWLIKADSLGNEQWSKTFGGPEMDVGRSVEQTSDGGYVVTGYQKSISAGYSDIGLLKTDSNGNLLWFKNIGGVEADGGNSLKITSDGGYIIAGFTSSFGAGNSDVYLVKIEPEVTSVREEESIQSYQLSQNYPNPFNSVTIIKYRSAGITFVTLKIYDVLGNEIATLVNEEKPSGSYELTWNGDNLPSGVYFYQIQAGSFMDTKKMILLK